MTIRSDTMKPASAVLFILLLCSELYAQYEPILSIKTNEVQERVLSFAITNDGSQLVTGGYDFLRLWNASTGELLHEFDIPFHDIVYSMNVSDDGKYLVTGHFNDVNLWDLKSYNLLHKKYVRKLDNSYSGVSSVAIIPDRNSFYAGDSVGYLEEFDITTGESKLKEDHGPFPIINILITSNNNYFIFDFSGIVARYRVDPFEGIEGKKGLLASISSDGTVLQILTGDTKNGYKLEHLNAETFDTIREFEFGQGNSIGQNDISPDGKSFLVTIYGQRYVRMLYDAVTPGPIRTYILDENAELNSPHRSSRFIKFFPDGKKFLTVNGDTIHIWDISDVVTSVESAHLHDN